MRLLCFVRSMSALGVIRVVLGHAQITEPMSISTSYIGVIDLEIGQL